MSKTNTDLSTEDSESDGLIPTDRRGFLKLSAAGAAGAALAPSLSTLGEADELLDASLASTDGLAEQTGEWRASTCGGCTSWCASEILVDDGRAVKVRGNSNSKIHGKANCPRKHLGIQQMYDPDRVTQPLRRTNPNKGPDEDPEFEPISWEEAIDEIADHIIKLRENEETHKAMVTRGRYTYLRPILYSDFPSIVGTPNNISHSAICAEAEKFGPYYTEAEWAYRQYDVENTDYVIAWGADPVVSNRQVSYYTSEWGDMLDDATVAVVEPRLSATASQADEFLPVEPGEDGAIAVAMAHVILRDGLWNEEFVGQFEDGENRFEEGEDVDPDTFEESENSTGVVTWWNEELKDKTPEWAEDKAGVEADKIERVATDFAEAGPNALVWMGGGPVMQVRGSYTSMAVHALNGLVGSVGNEGGTLYSPPDGTAGLPGADEFIDDIAQQGLDYPAEHDVTGDKIDQRGAKDQPVLKDGQSGGGVVTNNAADGMLEEDPMEIKLLISYWNNYAFSNPENQRWIEALQKLEGDDYLHVTIETNPSETAWFADIVLPATHHQFERWGQLRSTAGRRRSINLHQPVLADDPDDPEDVLENGRLWNVKSDETEIVYLIADALAEKGFDNLLDYCEQYEDPETGQAPSDEYDDLDLRAQAFSRNAIKLRMQPMWDPEVDHPGGDDYDGWEELREAGIWNSDEWEYRNRWPSEGGEFGTATGTFEFYSETLAEALQSHADRYDTDIDDILETCNYLARENDGDAPNPFLPHYEEPYIHGDDEYEFEFVDHKSRLNREGRSANTEWYQEFKDADPGENPDEDVAKIHPDDAADLGIEDGDDIVIESPVGEIECKARVWEGTQPGTVAKTFGQGHWAYGRRAAEVFGEEAKGGNNNRLIPADYDRLSGSSVFYGCVKVNVEPA